MTSRTLIVAAVALLAANVDVAPAHAQNLDAGKSAPQIFASTCAACHRSPRGLVKSVSAQALPGFLRQHYTTGTDMARQLSGYLIASGGVAEPRQARGKDDEPRRPAARAERPQAQPRQRPAAQPLRAWRLPWETESPAEAAAKSGAAQAEKRPQRAGTTKRRPRREEPQQETAEPAAAEPAVATPASHAPARTGRKGKPSAEERAKDHSAAAKDQVKDQAKDQAKDEAKDGSAAASPAVSPDKPAATEAPAAAPPPQEAGTGKADETAKAGDSKPEASETKPVAADADKPAAPLRADPVPQVTPAPDASADAKPASEADTKPASDNAAKPAEPSSPADGKAAPAETAPAAPKSSSESQ